jgi:hypothetical protein
VGRFYLAGAYLHTGFQFLVELFQLSASLYLLRHIIGKIEHPLDLALHIA